MCYVSTELILTPINFNADCFWRGLFLAQPNGDFKPLATDSSLSHGRRRGKVSRYALISKKGHSSAASHRSAGLPPVCRPATGLTVEWSNWILFCHLRRRPFGELPTTTPKKSESLCGRGLRIHPIPWPEPVNDVGSHRDRRTANPPLFWGRTMRLTRPYVNFLRRREPLRQAFDSVRESLDTSALSIFRIRVHGGASPWHHKALGRHAPEYWHPNVESGQSTMRLMPASRRPQGKPGS